MSSAKDDHILAQTHAYTHTQNNQINEPFLDTISEMMRTLSAQTSGKIQMIRGPIKKPDRALQKLVRMYNRDVACLTDLVRCTIVVAGLEEAETVLARLLEKSVVGVYEHTEDSWLHDFGPGKTMCITKLSNRCAFVRFVYS
jgi:hypothetical protein